MAKLNVFKNQYLSNLETSIATNIDHYKKFESEFFLGDGHGILESSYDIPNEVPVLDPENDPKNAIRLFEYLAQIDKTAASDPRLWAYLAHTTFCEYAVRRWGIDKKDGAERIVAQHLFTNGDARTLRRHAIARLWWATKLTVAPWEGNSFFGSLKKDDRYYYTRILMQDETTSSDLFERVQITSCPELFIPILDYLDNHPELRKRELWREFMKEIILTLGYRKIMTLDLDTLLAELGEIANDISKRSESSEGQQ